MNTHSKGTLFFLQIEKQKSEKAYIGEYILENTE